MGINKFRRKSVFKGDVAAHDDITMKEAKNIVEEHQIEEQFY